MTPDRSERAGLVAGDDLSSAEELLSFYEGSVAPEFEGARPTVRINHEDFDAILSSVRAAIATHPGVSRDTERMDWLENNGCGQFQGPHTYAPAGQEWFDADTVGSDYSPTLRDAIDAAQAAIPSDVEG